MQQQQQQIGGRHGSVGCAWGWGWPGWVLAALPPRTFQWTPVVRQVSSAGVVYKHPETVAAS